MTTIVKVKEVLDNNLALVIMDGSGECTDACEGCRGCSKGRGKEIEAVAKNPAGAKAGDRVYVYCRDTKLLGIAALLYILPVALFFLGYFIPVPTENLRILMAFAGLLVGMAICIFVNNVLKKRNNVMLKITEILD